MSAGRAHRRAGARWRLAQTMAEIADAPAYSLGRVGPHEVVAKGRAVFLVGPVPDGAPPELAAALRRRREATIAGRCACGARWHPGRVRPGHVATAALRHEDSCSAHNVAIAALAARLGWKWSA